MGIQGNLSDSVLEEKLEQNGEEKYRSRKRKKENMKHNSTISLGLWEG